MTAYLTQRQAQQATFEVELVRGDGRHLSRNWRSFAEASAAIERGLPRTIQYAAPAVAQLPTGGRFAFYVVLSPRPAKDGPAFQWVGLQIASLTRLAVPATPRQAPDLSRLVDQLGASTFQRRERAARRLETHGRAATGALLRAARKHPDLEVRRRAALLLEKLRLADGLAIERLVQRTSARG